MIAIVYLMFFLSGAAALVYEVVWVRSLSLVFGGSHLAVTTVLSVFMGGLALGSYVIGRRVDAIRMPFRLYGFLEIGIAASAVLFVLLMALYPSVYIPLAQAIGNRPLPLSIVRTLFAAAAMIVPTTLMGGTLPVLSRLLSGRSDRLGRHLSFLYGFNTLGAVAGTFAAGYLFLPRYGVSAALLIAIAANTVVGLAALALRKPASSLFAGEPKPAAGFPTRNAAMERPGSVPGKASDSASPKAVLWGIGISGFCALGYEILWTRILSIVIGTTVYGFTIMLVAFLTGIALGGGAYGLTGRILGGNVQSPARSVAGFGVVQVVIGAMALVATYSLRNLPVQSAAIQKYLLGTGIGEFGVRQGSSFLIAFAYMVVPAFFMGLAFPMAGKIHGFYRKTVGGAVGEVMAYNTVGAILGAAVSGYLLIYLFGIERSLQFLTVINVGVGLAIVAGTLGKGMWPAAGAAVLTAMALLGLALHPGWWRIWDMKYFAIYQNNQRGVFDNPERTRDAIKNTDVLFHHEGINETISVIKVKGGTQAILVNGDVVASSTRQDVQCQLTLGHLPMLLHKNPRKVWVLGLGTGMTLGAVSAHPEIEEVTLAEIESDVIPAARTFGHLNHHVIDNPKLKVVINDGRNHLLVNRGKYDVITADPIHPWHRGAAYLYTSEYYRLAAERLRPGGIICQWLPLYELTVADLKSVIRTFGENFRYMLLWMTHYDAELLGSNEPIVIDAEDLERRMSVPSIADDLKSVEMGSAEDFLSYFVAGTAGLRAFSRDGVVNTDDNLYLEFSAPLSVGVSGAMSANMNALARYRGSILSHLAPARGDAERNSRDKAWARRLEAARVYDRAHFLFFEGRSRTREFSLTLNRIAETDPGFAPGRFLKREYEVLMSQDPKLLRQDTFALLDENGDEVFLEISTVTMRIGAERAVVVFADNRAKEIYGRLYIDGRSEELDARIRRIADDVVGELKRIYRSESAIATGKGKMLPDSPVVSERFRKTLSSTIQQGVPESSGPSGAATKGVPE
jgi:spermidine synthase